MHEAEIDANGWVRIGAEWWSPVDADHPVLEPFVRKALNLDKALNAVRALCDEAESRARLPAAVFTASVRAALATGGEQ